MKKDKLISFIFFALFFVVSNSYAYTYPVCDTAPVLWSKIYPTPSSTAEQSWETCNTMAENYRFNKGSEFVSSCAAVSAVDTTNPSACMSSVCCPINLVSSANNLERSIANSAVITGVVIGEEKSAAEAFANSFWSTNPYPVVDGKVRTDGAIGLSYTTTLGDGETTVSVNVIAWKRGIYTNIGDNAVPLGDLGGSSGGSGTSIDYSLLGAAFISALTSFDVRVSNTNSLYDALSNYGVANSSNVYDQTKQALIDAGAMGVFDSGGGAGIDSRPNIDALGLKLDALTQIDARPNVDALGVKIDALGSGLNSSSALPLPSDNPQTMPDDDFSQGMANSDPERDGAALLSNFRNSSFVSSIFNLFDENNTKLVLSGAFCSFVAPIPFGSGSGITFSLCSYESLFSSMGTALLALSGIAIIFFIFE